MKNCAYTNMPKKKFRTARTKNKADKQQPSRNCKFRPDVQMTTCSFKGVQKRENNYWSDSNGTMYPK